jgi:hypothetical protein
MDNPVIDKYGAKEWLDAEGKYHRDGGPAVEYANGDKEWWQHGKRHRDDGPAIMYASGHKEWFQHGKYLSFDEWLNDVKMSDEDKVMMKLQYG